jgi:hypothetical protein
LYRIEDDGQRLFAGSIRPISPTDLAARWIAFLAAAERGAYIATYRGETLGADRSSADRYATLDA